MNIIKPSRSWFVQAVLIGAALIFPGLAMAQTETATPSVGDTLFTTQPVELCYMNAFLYAGGGQVHWKTLREFNSHQFVVERSTNRSTWSILGAMPAHPNDASTRGYVYYDNNISRYGVPVVYYRVQLVAEDGSFTYSPVRPVWLNKGVSRNANASGNEQINGPVK